MNSFIAWVGGKKLLRKEVIGLFPEKGTFDRYVEVFGGAGWVLFGADSHAKVEVYNDANSDLVNLFRCVKFHSEELQREIRSIGLHSRELFFQWRAGHSAEDKTDIQKAAMFYLLVRTSFGADTRSFSYSPRRIHDSLDIFPDIQTRLQRVIIEHLNYDDLIRRYDRSSALFYCDPPYYKTEKEYEAVFSPEDHVTLRSTLSDMKGRFVLSYNDCEYVRDLYKDFEITATQRSNNRSSGANGDRVYRELLIKATPHKERLPPEAPISL